MNLITRVPRVLHIILSVGELQTQQPLPTIREVGPSTCQNNVNHLRTFEVFIKCLFHTLTQNNVPGNHRIVLAYLYFFANYNAGYLVLDRSRSPSLGSQDPFRIRIHRSIQPRVVTCRFLSILDLAFLVTLRSTRIS